jgi:hypothetical protein
MGCDSLRKAMGWGTLREAMGVRASPDSSRREAPPVLLYALRPQAETIGAVARSMVPAATLAR